MDVFSFNFNKTKKPTNSEIENEEKKKELEVLKNKDSTESFKQLQKFQLHQEEEEDSSPPTLILDFLYLGSFENAVNHKTLNSLNIGFILNSAQECDLNNIPSSIQYLKLVVEDIVPNNCNQYDTFERAFKFFDKAKEEYEQSGKTCLCHCMRGRSRSATLVIAYLMSRFKWNLLKAYRHVKSRRSFIGPHSHLRKQLINYEKHLFGTNSMQLSEFKSYYTPID